MPKKKNTNLLQEAFLIDAFRSLTSSYEELLPSNVQRRLKRISRETGRDIDVFLEDISKKGTSQSKPLAKKALKLIIKDAKDTEKKWDTKFELITKIFKLNKTYLKEILDPISMKALDVYSKNKTLAESLNLIVKAKKLTETKDYPFIGTWVIKRIKKEDPKLYTKLLKGAGETEKSLIKEAIAPVKPAGKITHETHPGYFAPNKKRLIPPILEGTEDIKYNPKWKKDPTVWYAISIDPKTGDKHYHYSEDYYERMEVKKWEEVDTLREKSKSVLKKAKKDLKSPDPKIRAMALIVMFISTGKFRMGNTKSEKDNVYGLHNLKVGNLKLLKNKIKFSYTGKKERQEDVTVKVTPDVYSAIQKIIEGKDKEDPIFTFRKARVRPVAVNNYLKKLGAGTTAHKFRHLHATDRAKKYLLDDPKVKQSDSLAKKKKYLRESIKKIQQEMGHATPAMTKKAYINPSIVEEYEKRFGVAAYVIAQVIKGGV